jgi:hypothetical protein
MDGGFAGEEGGRVMGRDVFLGGAVRKGSVTRERNW